MTIDKIYTYSSLPKEDDNDFNNIQYALDDDVILNYLNRIVKNANRLESIEYKETSMSTQPGKIEIVFKLVKEYPSDNGDKEE